MKQKTSTSAGFGKTTLVIVLAIVAVLVFIPFALVHQAERQRNRVYRIDPGDLLKACRTMLSEKANYRHDNPKVKLLFGTGTVVLDPYIAPLQTNVPSVIRDLNPKLVIIGSNKVSVCLWSLPKRYLYGFAEGADEYGSEKITNGLWLWYGN